MTKCDTTARKGIQAYAKEELEEWLDENDHDDGDNDEEFLDYDCDDDGDDGDDGEDSAVAICRSQQPVFIQLPELIQRKMTMSNSNKSNSKTVNKATNPTMATKLKQTNNAPTRCAQTSSMTSIALVSHKLQKQKQQHQHRKVDITMEQFNLDDHQQPPRLHRRSKSWCCGPLVKEQSQTKTATTMPFLSKDDWSLPAQLSRQDDHELLSLPRRSLRAIALTQSMVPEPAMAAAIGPALGASLILQTTTTPTTTTTASRATTNNKALALVTWTLKSSSTCDYSLLVIPLVGCGDTMETSWQTARHVQHQIQTFIDQSRWSKTKDYTTSVFTRYLNLGRLITSRQAQWQRLLAERCLSAVPFSATPVNSILLCTKELEKVSKSPLQRSFDAYDVVLRYQEHYHPRANLTKINNNTTSRNDKNPLDEDVVGDTCLVCFETIPKDDPSGVSTVLSCGHRTCVNCWCDYLTSAANSGEGHVNCPAFRCNTRIDIWDAAHILFCTLQQQQQQHDDNSKPNHNDDDNEVATSHNAKVFDKLVQNSLEQCATVKLQWRHCSFASCQRFIMANNTDNSSANGWKFTQCECGMSCCASCPPSGGPAHPGVACKSFQKLCQSINSGKLDAEMANLMWVAKSTRPCPQCRYAIQKNEGCNHMYCTTCRYYFCWQCGGPGNECMAFFCRREHKYWYENAENDDGGHSVNSDLYRRMAHYRKLRYLRERVKGVHKAVAATSNNNNNRQQQQQQSNEEWKRLRLEFNLYQVLLWLQTFVCVQLVENDHDPSPGALHDAMFQLELMLHAVMLRGLAVNDTKAPALSFKTVPSLGNTPGSAKNSSKYVSPRKKQSLEQRDCNTASSDDTSSSLAALMAESDIQEFCVASLAELEQMARKAMGTAIDSLSTLSTPVAVAKYRRQRRPVAPPLVLETMKMERSRAPWKIGLRVQPPSVEEEEEQGNYNKPHNKKWKKGRSRVACLRTRALEKTSGDNV